MALLLLDEMRPRRLRDQLFGLDLSSSDFLTDIFDRPSIRSRHYARPWRRMSLARDVGSTSTIKSDKDKFQINMDVQHFAPDEISVKTADGCVIIEAKHEEKEDEHGFVTREFKRRYVLPEDCNLDTVESRLSTDGVLTVVASKASKNKGERTVPITQTGPVRRKHEEECQIENGEDHLEKENEEAKEKSPQKKRRR